MLFKVKPFPEWRRTFQGNERLWYTDTLLGRFHVQQSLSGEVWWNVQYGYSSGQGFKDIEAAKAAAEQWYTARLMEALEPATMEDISTASVEYLDAIGNDIDVTKYQGETEF
jgi:hypothetical protein